MINNPINANDPSGHQCNGAPDECLNANGQPINGASQGWQNAGGDLSTSSHPDRPDELNIDPDNEKLVWLYNAYRKMWDNPDGWWWDKYGSGGFTIWEFMGVMWAYEQQGYPNTEKYAAALGNHAPAWCKWKGCDASTAVGSLTFMARYNQVGVARAKDLFFNPKKSLENIFDAPKGYWPGDSMLIVEAIQNNYFSGDPHAPYDVGNVSMRSKIYQKMAALGMIDTVWGLPGQNRLVILTYCQWQMVNDAVDNGGASYINRGRYKSYCGG